MIEIRLGNRYARSIYKFAVEKGELEAVKEDFRLIHEVCESNSDFVQMLESPLIRSDKKQRIFDLIFKEQLSAITYNLVEIIIRKKREAYIDDIAICFLQYHDEANNVTRGILTSSHPMPEAEKNRIKKIVEADLKTEFIFDERVDPELIGGFVLRVKDTLYDGSFSSGLRRLKKEFENNPYIKT